jgi:hypothetical protein
MRTCEHRLEMLSEPLVVEEKGRIEQKHYMAEVSVRRPHVHYHLTRGWHRARDLVRDAAMMPL